MAVALAACGGPAEEDPAGESPAEESPEGESPAGEDVVEDSPDDAEDETDEPDEEPVEEPDTDDQADEEPVDDPQGDEDESDAPDEPDDASDLEHREGLSADRFGTETRQSEGFPDPLSPSPTGEDLLLTDVRPGAHEGYDRVVFDHHDTGLPGWHLEYVEEPTQPGSGHLIEMQGDAYLAVSVTGLRPGMAGEDQGHMILETDWAETDSAVRGTATTGVFEGAASCYISLDEPQEFDVFTLEDGSRLVVDILH